LIDVFTSAAVIPLGNYSFDTVNRARAIVQEYNEGVLLRNACEKILKTACPEAELPGGELYSVDIYLSQVAFDFIDDAKTRYEFKNLPTTFSLPAKTVDALKQKGKELLQNDPEFKRLRQDLHSRF
jgi:NTE family protein